MGIYHLNDSDPENNWLKFGGKQSSKPLVSKVCDAKTSKTTAVNHFWVLRCIKNQSGGATSVTQTKLQVMYEALGVTKCVWSHGFNVRLSKLWLLHFESRKAENQRFQVIMGLTMANTMIIHDHLLLSHCRHQMACHLKTMAHWPLDHPETDEKNLILMCFLIEISILGTLKPWVCLVQKWTVWDDLGAKKIAVSCTRILPKLYCTKRSVTFKRDPNLTHEETVLYPHPCGGFLKWGYP